MQPILLLFLGFIDAWFTYCAIASYRTASTFYTLFCTTLAGFALYFAIILIYTKGCHDL